MKHLLILLLFASEYCSACNSAQQNRLFFIGSCEKGFVFVETHLHRSDDPELKYEGSIWFGKAWMNIYNSAYKLIDSKLVDSLDTKQKRHEKEFFERSIAKALEQANKMTGFSEASPSYFSECNFRQDCNEVKLVFEKSGKQVGLHLKNGKKFPISILYDSTSIAEDYINYYKGFNSGDINWQRLYIGSVRKFKTEKNVVTIVHLSSGDSESYDGKPYPPGTERAPATQITDIRHSSFYEPVLHHGHGFDFFIVE